MVFVDNTTKIFVERFQPERRCRDERRFERVARATRATVLPGQPERAGDRQDADFIEATVKTFLPSFSVTSPVASTFFETNSMSLALLLAA